MAVEESRWGVLYCPKRGLFRSSKRWATLKRELDANGVLYDLCKANRPTASPD